MNTWSYNGSAGWVSIAALGLLVATCWMLLFPVRQPDYDLYLLPWLMDIRQSDSLKIFSTGFTNYTGGYVTIFWLAERVDFFSNGVLGDLGVIKVAAMIGSLLCSVGAWSVARALGRDRQNALAAAIGLLLLPEVLVNGIGWAQADGLYAAFLAFTVAAMIREKPTLAVVCFAVAVSTKLQAMWLAPLMVGWVLRRPYAVIPAIFSVPVAYVMVNALYLVAGRPVREVFMIYFGQFGTFERLSMSAPNLWLIADWQINHNWIATHYTFLIALGMTAGAIGAAWIAWQVYRLPERAGAQLLYWASMSTVLMPYLLPKMHDRFFFAGGIFTYLLALTDRRYISVVVLVQTATMLAYSQYHDLFRVAAILGRDVAGLLAVMFMTIAVVRMLQLPKASGQTKALPVMQALQSKMV